MGVNEVETLLALLRSYESRVYNVCFQVLRHPQDAQDAAQEVLLEVAQGARRVRDDGAFKAWLYRVAMNTALTHKRARARRAEATRRRAAMSASPAPTEDEREAVIDALGRLDDESRCLLIEHYFERVKLDDLARRIGVSAVAVWKRLDRAKERLRRALAGAGLALAAAQIAHALESIEPAAAPSGLVTASAVSKVALGGIAVGSKTTVPIVIAVAALLLVGAGAMIAARRKPLPMSAVETAVTVPQSTPTPADKASKAAEPAVASAPDSDAVARLTERLERFKAWRVEANKERRENVRRTPWGEQWTSEEGRKRWTSGHRQELAGMRELILAAPAPFVAFVRDPANADFVTDLLEFTLAKLANPEGYAYHGQKHSDFPAALIDGLHEALLIGSPDVQRELLRFFDTIQDTPPTYLDHYRRLMESGTPHIRAYAARIVCTDSGVRPDDLHALQAMAGAPAFESYRVTLLEALGRAPSAVADQWLLEQLDTATDDAIAGQMIDALGRRISFGKSDAATCADVLARGMVRLMQRPQGAHNEWVLITAVAFLPPEYIPDMLDRFGAVAKNEHARRAAVRLGELFKEGERHPVKLRQYAVDPEYDKYLRALR